MAHFLVHILGRLFRVGGERNGCATIWGHVETAKVCLLKEISYGPRVMLYNPPDDTSNFLYSTLCLHPPVRPATVRAHPRSHLASVYHSSAFLSLAVEISPVLIDDPLLLLVLSLLLIGDS